MQITKKDYKNTPTIITIFGATGDLSGRKLIPALFDLYAKELLPDTFHIVGVARSNRSDDEFHDFIRKSIQGTKHTHKAEQINNFLEHITYKQGLFDDVNSYADTGDFFIKKEKEWGSCASKLFYLATPPSFYDVILRNLADSGFTVSCGGDGWTRILLEKPFGSDAESAKKLDELLAFLFAEEQIFRIDHYLAKEVIQNILSFRFSNLILSPIWNNKYIEKVEIKLFETIDVGDRGSFYDNTGALRDVGENHILQMLSAVAMDNPGVIGEGYSDSIRRRRADVIKSLLPIDAKNINKYVRRGQYDGYRDTDGVKGGSRTETFFSIEAYLDMPNWRGVPFYLQAGKKMKEKKAEISLFFKKTDSCLCPAGAEQHHQNILTFRIQPNEGISIRFWVNTPGFANTLDEKQLSFTYEHSAEEFIVPAAYENVILDCIVGDQTSFTSTDEVDAAWKFITPIIRAWESIPLDVYTNDFNGLSDRQ